MRQLANHPHTRLSCLLTVGRIEVRWGLSTGAATLDEAWALAQEIGESEDWDVAAGRAEAAWLAGRPEDIEGIVGEPYERALADGTLPAASELAFWMWRAGALPEPPRNIVEAFRLHVDGDWRAAAAAWRRSGCPYEEAEALSDGDEAAMRKGLSIFSRMGAEPAADRLRLRMRKAGLARIPARPRRSTRSAPAQLTRREVEILGLVEQGLTNAEIAGRLFITEKTAGHHVSAILAKLGARTRTEAASTARKMGIAASGNVGRSPEDRTCHLRRELPRRWLQPEVR